MEGPELYEEAWSLLRQGNMERGLALLKQEYQRSKGPSNAIGLGVGKLWANRYKDASRHFEKAIETGPTAGEKYYGLRGVAEWCAGNSQGAILAWEEGLNAQYAEDGVCTHSALLLLLASILNSSYPLDVAEAALLGKLKNPRVKGWTGALGKFMVEQIGEQELKERWTDWVELNERGILPHRKWLTEFYRAILTLSRREMSVDEFRKLAKSMTDLSTMGSMSDKDFRALVRNEEFFIARYEGSQC